ncbi:hypothetical protein ACQPXH_21545 [Nocardia sp. CA-135953]|uniref:hypothetical protein n=1 Tax=Nocardia sp. CA-135953 TaxID=3239978 RepID=UPI003D99FFD8
MGSQLPASAVAFPASVGMPHSFAWSDGKFWVHTTIEPEAVRVLRDHRHGWRQAVLAYNHSTVYINQVRSAAIGYES